MGLPVAKEELAKVAAESSSSIQATAPSSGSPSGSKVRTPFSLISLCKKLGAVTGLLVVSAFLDLAYSETSDVWVSAVVSYATAIVAMVAISRVVVAQRFQSDFFPCTCNRYSDSCCNWLLGIQHF